MKTTLTFILLLSTFFGTKAQFEFEKSYPGTSNLGRYANGSSFVYAYRDVNGIQIHDSEHVKKTTINFPECESLPFLIAIKNEFWDNNDNEVEVLCSCNLSSGKRLFAIVDEQLNVIYKREDLTSLTLFENEMLISTNENSQLLNSQDFSVIHEFTEKNSFRTISNTGKNYYLNIEDDYNLVVYDNNFEVAHNLTIDPIQDLEIVNHDAFVYDNNNSIEIIYQITFLNSLFEPSVYFIDKSGNNKLILNNYTRISNASQPFLILGSDINSNILESVKLPEFTPGPSINLPSTSRSISGSIGGEYSLSIGDCQTGEVRYYDEDLELIRTLTIQEEDWNCQAFYFFDSQNDFYYQYFVTDKDFNSHTILVDESGQKRTFENTDLLSPSILSNQPDKLIGTRFGPPDERQSDVYGGLKTNVGANHNIQISIYPNPTKDVLLIENHKQVVIESIEIITVGGKACNPINATKELENKISIDVSKLQRGAFVLRLKTNLGVKSIMFFKTN